MNTKITSRFILFMLLMATLLPGNVKAEKDDPTLSPYFFIKTDNPAHDQLPLKHTEANVNIAGVIADVVVKQIYTNAGKKPIEAIYVFPGSTHAAVYGMKMTIGKRVLFAQIQKKEDARKTYEAAKQEGKTASLLEQERPNVFQMNVANIMPGDSVVVELRYTELLIPTNRVYEFVYPTVVGPRYSSPTQELASAANDKWVSNPYQHEGETPLYSYGMKAAIHAGMPIQEAVCSSHEVDIKFKGTDVAEVNLKGSETQGGNRDFILRYRLAGAKIQTGILVYEGEEENFFVAMLQPPKRVLPENIPGREYIFIVDVSGSMNGFPIDISKTLLKDLIGSLRPNDLFNVMLFAGGNSVMSESSLPATKENIDKAISVIERQRGGGGTELLPALKRALNLKRNENYSRSVVIATDGYVSVEKEAFDLIRNNLGRANFFTFGIGSSVNRYILEGMAHVGMGEDFVITDGKYAKAEADKFRSYIASPVLTNINVNYGDFGVYNVEPSSVPDVLAERPIIITGKFKGKPEGKITVRGISGGGTPYETTLDLATASIASENEALKYLWARKKIQLLNDYASVSSPQQEEVTALGLKYNLLTNYTSFVAVDTEVRNQGGKQATINQPLPLPEGVSDLAVNKLQSVTISSAACAVAVTEKQNFSGDYLNGTLIVPESTMETYDWAERATKKEAALAEASAKAKSEAERKALEEASRLVEEKRLKEEAEAKAKAEAERIFIVAEQMPEFPGGEKAMLDFVKNNMIYPQPAKEKGISGTVYLSFVIDRNGKITAVKVVHGVSQELDKEAARILKLMPEWIPGKQNGNAVNVQMSLPIKFEL